MSTDATTPVKPVERLPEFAGILRDEELYSTGTADDAAERLNGWFDRLMLQSGLETPPSMVLLLSVCAAVGLGGAAFVVQENLLSTALCALLGSLVPIGVVLLARNRRQSKMLKQMPEMIGELARAARTGRSLEQCFHQIAEDTPAPLGDEIRRAVRKMQMGLPPGAALKDLPERTGLASLNVLAMALSVHQQTGGDLVTVLERLSRTIRDRLAFLGRLRAATAVSRATAVLMIALPPGILAFFVFRDPAYLTDLTSSSWGRNSLLLAILLQVIGSAWVLRILRSSQRT